MFSGSNFKKFPHLADILNIPILVELTFHDNTVHVSVFSGISYMDTTPTANISMSSRPGAEDQMVFVTVLATMLSTVHTQ